MKRNGLQSAFCQSEGVMSRTDYKATLNLPKTGFPMKASLSSREPLLLEEWAKEDIYGKILSRRRGGKKFLLHDGPPYANGDIHMGHALNKILKDIVVKYKTMRGHYCPFVPGWDCHGLPVEHQLFRSLKISKHQIDRREFREKAGEYALKYVSIQKEQFKRLGIFGDWDNPYLTMDPSYQATIIKCFGRLYLDGYIYRGLKPIHWCAACETALAEAEVEYDEHRAPSIYVAFPVVSGLRKAFPGLENAELLIWTTTPWTLPANKAVAVRPDYDYQAVRCGERTLIVAKKLLERVADEIGWKDYRPLASCRGKDLEGIVAKHPFLESESPVVFSDHVTLEQGTGCVHIAPGHGDEDYQVGRKFGLEIFAPVNARGEFTDDAGVFAGMKVQEANGKITERLREKGMLLSSREISHSYPHCWRCKKPVIFRATTQWFLGVDRKELRRRALEAVSGARWIPERGRNRIGSMIENRPDWCLSRQRYWGAPIPILYCEGCGEAVLTEETLRLIGESVARRGADVWFIEPAEAFLPKEFACPACGGKAFRKEEDIIDVWFDSGISHQAVLAARPELGYPCSLYLEGSDQHRGWFQTSLLTAIALRGSAPFDSVMTHGFIMDGEGKKMSKSAGNVIAPQKIIREHGADILRLWTASVDYGADVRISGEILTHLVEAYRRIRNTLRFLLGNLHDFRPEEDAVPYDGMEEIDRWILSRAESFLEEVTSAYERYDFSGVYHRIHNFCAVDLSSLYLDILKDRLYTRARSSPVRRSAQSAMMRILEMLVKMCAPILAFTAEEAWKFFPGDASRGGSVHLADWPERNERYISERLEKKWEKLLGVRKEVSKALETARQGGLIGNSLGAMVELSCPEGELLDLLREKERILADLFIVSQVVVRAASAAAIDGPPAAEVSAARGDKCGRCWRYVETVGKNAEHPTLCDRCIGVVEKI